MLFFLIAWEQPYNEFYHCFMLEMCIMEWNISSIVQIRKHVIDRTFQYNETEKQIKVPGIMVQKMEQRTEANQVLADDQHEC